MTRLASLFARLGPDPRADGTLLRTFLLDRDEAAFAELVRRHGPTVWGVCRRQLADADAEDAFQATFLVLLRRRPGGDSLAPWLYRVAVLTSRGLRRKNARRRTVPLPELPARPVPAVDVDELLIRLPERERAAVVLCHLHGLTQREAADKLGVPEGTLSARLSRGLAKLRGASPVVLAVPAGLAEAAVTVATAGRAAGPGVSSLVTEVLRMFWLKKLATVGLAVAAVGGFGLGLAARPTGAVAATDPPAARKPATPQSEEATRLEKQAAELTKQLVTLDAEVNKLYARMNDLRRQRGEVQNRLRQLAGRPAVWRLNFSSTPGTPPQMTISVEGGPMNGTWLGCPTPAAYVETLRSMKGVSGWPQHLLVTLDDNHGRAFGLIRTVLLECQKVGFDTIHVSGTLPGGDNEAKYRDRGYAIAEFLAELAEVEKDVRGRPANQ